MKNFGNKIDNDETSAGVVVANEYNSIFNEAKGAVTPFLELNELDNQQLGKAIDIASKATFYNDVGTPNAVHLTRGATNEQIETLFDGMVVFFSPANANTGASTLKVNGLGAKAMKFNDSALVAGMLIVGVKYIAVYKLSDDSFHIDVVANNKMPSELVDKTYVDGRFDGLKILNKVFYKNTSTTLEEVVNASSPWQTSIGFSYTPVSDSSKTIVECSGNFRVTRGALGVCGMDIYLKDGATLLNSKYGFIYDSYSSNIHHNPNMVYIDERGGATTRNYQIWIAPHITGNNLSYIAPQGQASMIITEVI